MHTGFLAVPALFSALCWQKKRLQSQWERWCAGRQQGQEIPAPARGGRELQDARKGFGGLGKGCQRVTWQEAAHIQWSPPALPSVCNQTASRTSLPALLCWRGLDKPPGSAFGESCLRSQSWVLGKWLLYFKRVVERKEQPQSKPLRKILQ